MPGFPVTARAATTTAVEYVTLTLTSSGVTTTTTWRAGNSFPTTVPAAHSPPPTNGTVIGAIVGSILGFIVLLILILYCIRNSRADWAPHLGSSRSSFSSVYVYNPSGLPVVAPNTDLRATTQVVRDKETRTFSFTRPSRKRQHAPVSYQEERSTEASDVTSASSASSRG